MNNPPYDPNNLYSQQTTPGQYPTFNQQPGQPSYPQWSQQTPPFNQQLPYPQPGQFGPPPQPPGPPAAVSPPLKPCSDGVLSILFLLNIILWICAFFSGGVGNFGKSGVTGIVFTMLIIDWKGVLTFDGKITWKKFGGGKRFLLFCLYFAVLPLALIGYFVRRINADTEAKKQKLPALPARKGRPALAIVIGFFVFIFVLAGSSGNASAGAGTTTTTPAPTQQIAHAAPTQRPIPKPTATPMPSPTPTPMPTPEPTQPPAPAQQPVQQQPVQQAPPPAAPPSGVNGNPWGYDFNPGNYITDPPSAFCSYFNCIASFWNGKGHVEECQDATYSKSGGISGSCSKHGGDWRPLYSH